MNKTKKNLLETCTETAEERLEILNTRDALLRSTSKKQISLESSKKNLGTCPDMCPEKERYQREIEHQISYFEEDVDKKKINHQIAIKQYIRSSADQVEPLSHELRPTPVLEMTMNYIINEVLDECEKNIGEWYHFIWNRTRAIRKDITQQELCNPNVVELVEQCARFHIYCSERLIEEDISIYDDKINTENLTKCLQTLKYMYSDLSKKGIQCQNESEFRSYMIYLNLNKGNCLGELQKLNENIRKSSHIILAKKIFLSLNTNNYVKFFNLMKNAPYLVICILRRYFLQIRYKTFLIIIKAYTIVKRNIKISINFLNTLLGFYNNNNNDSTNQEALEFYQHLNLKIMDNNNISLSRSFTLPTCSYPQKRAWGFIPTKLDTIKPIILGNNSFDSYRLLYKEHKCHSSFNSNGKLNPDALDGNDQEKKLEFYNIININKKVYPNITSSTATTTTTTTIKPFTYNIEQTITSVETNKRIIKKGNKRLHSDNFTKENYESKKMNITPTTISTKTPIKPSKQSTQMAIQQQHQTDDLHKEIPSTIDVNISSEHKMKIQIPQKEVIINKTKQKRIDLNEILLNTYQTLILDDILNEILKEICEKILLDEKIKFDENNKKLLRINDIRSKLVLEKIRLFFKKWINYIKMKREKRLEEDFQAWIGFNQNSNSDNSNTYNTSLTINRYGLLYKQRLVSIQQQQQHFSLENPQINIKDLLYYIIKKQLQNYEFNKILLPKSLEWSISINKLPINYQRYQFWINYMLSQSCSNNLFLKSEQMMIGNLKMTINIEMNIKNNNHSLIIIYNTNLESFDDFYQRIFHQIRDISEKTIVFIIFSDKLFSKELFITKLNLNNIKNITYDIIINNQENNKLSYQTFYTSLCSSMIYLAKNYKFIKHFQNLPLNEFLYKFFYEIFNELFNFDIILNNDINFYIQIYNSLLNILIENLKNNNFYYINIDCYNEFMNNLESFQSQSHILIQYCQKAHLELFTNWSIHDITLNDMKICLKSYCNQTNSKTLNDLLQVVYNHLENQNEIDLSRISIKKIVYFLVNEKINNIINNSQLNSPSIVIFQNDYVNHLMKKFLTTQISSIYNTTKNVFISNDKMEQNIEANAKSSNQNNECFTLEEIYNLYEKLK